jgi:MinD-like ATPase involved in chromosome partitioning or flagellar assembly
MRLFVFGANCSVDSLSGVPIHIGITIAADSVIQITCTSVHTQAGTYATVNLCKALGGQLKRYIINFFFQFYDMNGAAKVTTSPTVVNQVYTTTDNTLLIESLAGSSASSTHCCTWTTI